MENNKLIAEFMGWKRSVIDTHGVIDLKGFYVNSVPYTQTMYGEPYSDIDKLKFHNSCDWLMPVIDKMFQEWVPTESGPQKLINLKLQKFQRLTPINSSIQQVYKNVVEYIKCRNDLLITKTK